MHFLKYKVSAMLKYVPTICVMCFRDTESFGIFEFMIFRPFESYSHVIPYLID